MKCKPQCRIPAKDRPDMCEHGSRAMKMAVLLDVNMSKYITSLPIAEQAAIRLRYGSNLYNWYCANAMYPELDHFRSFRKMLLDNMADDCLDYYVNIMKPEIDANER